MGNANTNAYGDQRQYDVNSEPGSAANPRQAPSMAPPPAYQTNSYRSPYPYHQQYYQQYPYYNQGYNQQWPQGSYYQQYPMYPPPQYGGIPPAPPTVPEPQTTVKIKNEVNVKRSTVKLDEDPENLGQYLLSFTFDAATSGCIEVFYLVKEGEKCSFSAEYKNLCFKSKMLFEKGYSQKFKQEAGTGIDFNRFGESLLSILFEPSDTQTIPLVIRILSEPRDLPRLDTNVDLSIKERIFSPEPLSDGFLIPEWINGQVTFARLAVNQKGTGSKGADVKVEKQMIWFQGQKYELQEIYGLEQSSGSAGTPGSNPNASGSPETKGDSDTDPEPGSECVICLVNPRDTAVLPCRHMCMCKECSQMLRLQDSRCPICRQNVESLLEIRVSKPSEVESTAKMELDEEPLVPFGIK